VPINIVPSSMAAQAIADKKKNSDSKYPFGELEVGQSFTVPIAEANVNSLRVMCSRKSKGGKSFTLVVHQDPPVVEVARLA